MAQGDSQEHAETAPPKMPKRPRRRFLAGEQWDGVQRAGVLRAWLREMTRQTPSWLSSMIIHMGLLIVLAWFTLPPGAANEMVNHLVVSSNDKSLEKLEHIEQQRLDEVDLETLPEEVLRLEETVATRDTDMSPVEAAVPAASTSVELDDFGLDTAPRAEPMIIARNSSVGALSWRGDDVRKALVAKYGGTSQSERAVAQALKWLEAHQFADGGWSFAHHLAPKCRGRCRNPSDVRFASSRNAATGLALLPFLGAGQTHKKGKYRKVVQAGLYFLANRQNPETGSLWEPGGRMYSHGIASTVLCEAYAMTHDRSLFGPSQKAIQFIVAAQDSVGGGWRYDFQQPGDTSVVGWQIMALKSGYLAYLSVPETTVRKASLFLDSVQSPSGANYGYVGPGDGPSTEATTAIGLLCRMLLGWKKTEPDLEHGVQWLSRRGPNKNLYYDYYATQVLRHWEGQPWRKWNAVMRDQLVDSQAKKNHEAGSWFISDEGNRLARHNQLGGRLYCTAMATMILEVYYRHMPIYGKQSTEADFPLK